MSSAATCPDCQTAPSALELARARDAWQKAARLDADPATYEEYPYGSRLGAAFLQAYNAALAEIAAWRAAKGV